MISKLSINIMRDSQQSLAIHERDALQSARQMSIVHPMEIIVIILILYYLFQEAIYGLIRIIARFHVYS